MNECSKCGNNFDGKFCPECGTAFVQAICSKCGAVIKGKFCSECGAEIDLNISNDKQDYIYKTIKERSSMQGAFKKVKTSSSHVIISDGYLGLGKKNEIDVNEITQIIFIPVIGNYIDGFGSITFSTIKSNHSIIHSVDDAKNDSNSVLFRKVLNSQFNRFSNELAKELKIEILTIGDVEVGNLITNFFKSADEANRKKIERKRDMDSEGIAYCPRCHSVSLSANKKGYGIGKGLIGALIPGVGLIGLAAGNIGAKKIRVTCLKCGHQFWAGKR